MRSWSSSSGVWRAPNPVGSWWFTFLAIPRRSFSSAFAAATSCWYPIPNWRYQTQWFQQESHQELHLFSGDLVEPLHHFASVLRFHCRRNGGLSGIPIHWSELPSVSIKKNMGEVVQYGLIRVPVSPQNMIFKLRCFTFERQFKFIVRHKLVSFDYEGILFHTCLIVSIIGSVCRISDTRVRKSLARNCRPHHVYSINQQFDQFSVVSSTAILLLTR